MSKIDFEKIKEDVEKAKEICTRYIAVKLDQYETKEKNRRAHGVPILAFCGHGRAGKDLAAAWLGGNYDVEYAGSISYAICPLVASAQGRDDVSKVFEERHKDRMYWFEFCNELRRKDPTFLLKMTLGQGDVVAGVRGDIELAAGLSESVIDLAIWVENPRVEVDPTVDYIEEDCDLTIHNHGTKLEYFRKLKRLAEMLHIPKRER